MLTCASTVHDRADVLTTFDDLSAADQLARCRHVGCRAVLTETVEMLMSGLLSR